MIYVGAIIVACMITFTVVKRHQHNVASQNMTFSDKLEFIIKETCDGEWKWEQTSDNTYEGKKGTFHCRSILYTIYPDDYIFFIAVNSSPFKGVSSASNDFNVGTPEYNQIMNLHYCVKKLAITKEKRLNKELDLL